MAIKIHKAYASTSIALLYVMRNFRYLSAVVDADINTQDYQLKSFESERDKRLMGVEW